MLYEDAVLFVHGARHNLPFLRLASQEIGRFSQLQWRSLHRYCLYAASGAVRSHCSSRCIWRELEILVAASRLTLEIGPEPAHLLAGHQEFV